MSTCSSGWRSSHGASSGRPARRPMFFNLLTGLKKAGLPVSVGEYLSLIGAVKAGVAATSIEDFYYLSRASLVKDERHLDRFDRVFGEVFKGIESDAAMDAVFAKIPAEW